MTKDTGLDPSIPPSGAGCVECDADGGWWFHLWRCAQCGHIGCCDDSPAKHATGHFRDTGHPVIRSYARILARSRRSVVVIYSGSPRNAPAKAVHGLIALDGTPPSEILRRGREQVRQYGGRVVHGEVVSAESAAPSADGDLRFTVTLADGRRASRPMKAASEPHRTGRHVIP